MDLLAELESRGLIHDTTDRVALGDRLQHGPIGVYVGFDPTADSLHVGHLVGQLFLRRFQLGGHKPVPLAGGATGMVGDPSGRSDERNLLDLETLRYNVSRIEGQLQRLLDFEPGPFQARLVNNADWTEPITLLDFLRTVGKHSTINQMLAKDSVRSRLEGEGGLSFTEFSYSLLQANDFRHLYENLGVELQAGGSDQWGNIVAGVDLIRRTSGCVAHALTHPLVTKADGTKFGKSADGAVWLAAERTSPYQFHQFWVQVDDAMIGRYLQMFSLQPIEVINDLVERHAAAPERRIAQRALGDELTALVHGSEVLTSVQAAALVLFGGDPTVASADALAAVAREVSSSTTSANGLADQAEVLVEVGLAVSKGEARRLISQGGVRANGVVLSENDQLSGIVPLHGNTLLIRRGKAAYHLLVIS